MSYISLVGFLTASISILMLIMVLLAEKKKAMNLLISLIFLTMVIFGGTLFFSGYPDQDTILMLSLWRLSYAGLIMLPPMVYHLTLILIRGSLQDRPQILMGMYGISGAMEILNMLGLMISHVEYRSIGYYDGAVTFYGYIFGAFLFSVLIYTVGLCIRAYRQISSIQRHQILYFFLSILMGGVGGIFFYLPGLGIDHIEGALLLAGYPGLLAYAILRYQFFDIRHVAFGVLRLFFSITVGLVIISIFIFLVFGSETLADLLGARYLIFYFLAITIGFFLYQSRRLKSFFSPREREELKRVLTEFLVETTIYDSTSDIEGSLRGRLRFFLQDDLRGVTIYDREMLEGCDRIREYFRQNTDPLIRYSDPYEEYHGEVEAEVIFPLYSSSHTLNGLLLLGKKQSGSDYTQEDIDLLSRLLLKLSLSLQVLDHNLDLRMEVLSRTEELTLKNEELSRAYADLKRVDDNKDTFLAIASHELRTPMTIIKGYSDMLMRGAFGALNEQQSKYLSQIYTSTEDLISFVNNILDISKLEAGRMIFTIEPCDHHTHITRVFESFRALYSEKAIDLTLTDSSKHDIIRTDSAKLTVILNNLLSNAYKFTTTGGSVHIEIRDERYLGKLCIVIAVADSGVGMSPETLSHIFDKFSQSSNQDYTKKSIQGSGLGLHLIREIIHHLGGDILALSGIGTGTTMTVYLPIDPEIREG